MEINNYIKKHLKIYKFIKNNFYSSKKSLKSSI